MNPSYFSIRLNDCLIDPVDSSKYRQVVLSRKCTFEELIECIKKIPRVCYISVNGEWDVTHFDMDILDCIDLSLLQRKVDTVFVSKMGCKFYFRVNTKSPEEPLTVRFTRTSPVGLDETGAYRAEFSRECTVKEVIALALSNKSEWGTIFYKGTPIVEYKNGSLDWESPISGRFRLEKLTSCRASGGWGRMDYYIS